MSAAAAPIEVDHRTGRVSGAGPVERCGVAIMQAAAAGLSRFDDFGFSHVARAVRTVFPSRRSVRIVLTEDAVFEMPYGDGYWGVLLPRAAVYEADTEPLLRAIAGIDYAFVDCGANYGYWSVVLSSSAFGRHPTIAVEAAPDTYAWLARNAEINGGRFAALNRAVAGRSGERLALYGGKHESRSLAGGDGAEVLATVETLALDDLLAREELKGAPAIVLKLDVEGVEVAALEGGQRMLERDVLIAYEDHGSDREHAVSRHLAEALGMRLFAVAGGRVRPLGGFDVLSAIKRNPRFGYNFFATRSSFWIGEMERLAGQA